MAAARLTKSGRCSMMLKNLHILTCYISKIVAAFLSFLVSDALLGSPSQNHQVFINFRGDQVRHNFVSHLTNAFKNQGIKFFVDNDMQPGEDLKNLFVKIEESRIALAIFSTRYPESKWCMNELVKMKKRSDEGKLHVIPIFYKVNPSHVKEPTRKSEFGKNFWELAEASRVEDPIQEWREALKCIANKSGLPLGDESSEADFIKEIVEKVEGVNKQIGLVEEKKRGEIKKEGKFKALQYSRGRIF